MHKINITLIFFLIFTIVGSALAYVIIKSADDGYQYDYSDVPVIKQTEPTKENNYSDLIKISSPLANEVIESPLLIKGEARGNWYFEASFPVRLYDANNKKIPLTPPYIMATGEWMTTEFVPFEATLTFEKPTTSTGNLVLEKDNPSGLPENDAKISIPVKFSQ